MNYFNFFVNGHTPDYHLSPNGQYKSPIANNRVANEVDKALKPYLADAPTTFENKPTRIKWIVFWEKGHKIMDEDNLIKSLKRYQDLVARALGINDVHITTSVRQERDRSGKGAIACLVRQ